MIEITLKSPKVYVEDKSAIMVIISHQMYSDNQHGIRIPVKHTVLIESKEVLPDGKYKLPISVDVVSSETVSFLYEVKKKIGSCVQLAESLFESLKAINLRLVNRDVNSDVYKNYSDKYSKLDFMGHRTLLSDIIKSKKDPILNEIIKEYESKKLRKVMNDFILDRNKYTHGDLMYFQNMRTTIIKYIHEGIEQYALVSQEIIESFISCYENLNVFLGKLLKELNQDEYQKLFPNNNNEAIE